ncbi:hypothetical protein CK203_101697 [Vitis vinifera]|uniref:Reverse transcriptase/retrotransposon-derived protein RNase H-like domain-containing protein n=1 Tax=Vitis vinifera TaxID=29760 RepID=A0A438FH25_VITVI|nr:hypothetical protein CK203_101697 [Vitis vinifera]
MCLWRECWQISGIYGQPKRHRSQPGSSQSSHGDTSSQEQKGVTTPHRQARCVRTFIARFTDELRPFFLAIRKAGTQGWTDNCQNALERIKHCLMHPPILSSPIPKEKLYMYLAVSEWAISAVLFRCPSPKEQKPVYYVSSIGRCRNQVFKNGANSLSSSKCCPKAPPLFSSPPSDCTDRPTPS